jgi:hypothetical protein
MNRLQNVWRPLLLGTILIAILVGVVGAVPTEKPSALSAPRQLVIAASDFDSIDNVEAYVNIGWFLKSGLNNTSQYFIAPLDFPVPYYATIDRFELFALDNNSTDGIKANIYLLKPSQGTVQEIASINTGSSFADPADPYTWSTTAISPNVKKPANDLYVHLQIDDDTALQVYGVRIWYRAGK